MRPDVDPRCLGVEPQPHPGRLQIGVTSVGEVLPVHDLARDVIRNATYGEIWVGVGHDHGHVDTGVEFPSAEPAEMPASLPPMATKCMLAPLLMG